MTQWHPATKILVLAALLVLPYLLWTGSTEPTPVVAASVTREAPVAADIVAVEPPPTPLMLPPLERFTAVVERPLFSPTRRMPTPPPVVREAPEAPVAEAPVDQGPEEPELRFFGTVRQGGTAAALVTYPATAEVARLRPGDTVGDWEVLSVDRNRLELGLGEERRSFEIFGAGMRGSPQTTEAPVPSPAADPAGPGDGAEWDEEGMATE